ncbi:unnamed protein product [Heligmosomoides polygyrus]|uniref:CUB domain-containing protein n=1 Tax=Heligmosomoides polygyrus TaxID=6339 RepID=A0A183GJW2_HELPZ|nr:unnamed protein product [Heligmosomoides polygyrus]
MSLPRSEIRARSGFLWIRFHSDDLLEYKGFFATYDMVRTNDRKANQHDCQIQFHHALDGYIETKTLISDLPMNFTGSLDCIWLLEVPHEYNIVLYINEFSLYAPNHCGLNFLEVYSGTTSDQPLRSCGDDNCVPQALACNGRNNCPYGNDEQNCHDAQDFFFRFIFNSYSPLIFLILFVFLAVLGLFLWYYWPKECCKRRKRR